MCVFQALSTLRSISLDQCYRQVENLAGKLEDLKQRFGLSSTQRLVHSVHLEMEKVWSSVGGSVMAFSWHSATFNTDVSVQGPEAQ